MNPRLVFRLVSAVLLIMAAAMGICAAASYALSDPPRVWKAFLLSALLAGSAGGGGICLARPSVGSDLGRRDGLAVVALGWIAAALAGALPYLISGLISDPVGAVFETMSGLTTTGATVLSGLEGVPRGLLLWRATTHFLGGMGVLVLCVAILPLLKVGGMQIYRAEIPGPEKERLTPRIVTTARALWGVYVLLCILEILLLRVGGMSTFEAVCHTFATMATGGFSTRSGSIGDFHSVYVETVIIVFMLLAGANFALHYQLLRGRLLSYLRNAEFRSYVGIWAVACLLLMLVLRCSGTYPGWSEALRRAVFQGTSIMTTTGFTTADFDGWPESARLILLVLMFIGGCAGSTGGGMKVFRVVVAAKKAARDLMRFMRPRVVVRIWLGEKVVEEETVSHVASFVLLFVGVWVMASLAMSFFTPDLVTALSAVAATLGNIGPGLGAVGAAENYAAVPVAGKVILTLCMLLGRLELYTVLVLLMPTFWRR